MAAAFEIDQVEFFGQFHVIERFEVEFRQGSFAAEQFQVRFVVHAHGRLGMGHVGDRAVDLIQFDGDGVDFGLDGLVFFPQPASFFLACFALGGVFGLADGFRDLVRQAVEVFDLGLQLFSFFFERDEAIHVDVYAAVLQFCLTSSAFSRMNLRSSMGSLEF